MVAELLAASVTVSPVASVLLPLAVRVSPAAEAFMVSLLLVVRPSAPFSFIVLLLPFMAPDISTSVGVNIPMELAFTVS
jgi:hypothetical protein